MRTIMFRIWSEKFKRYFYTVDDFRKLYQSIDELDEGLSYYEWWQPLISYYLLNTESEIIYEDGSKYILEQSTGLYDKNGKEIYEGDIVQERGLRETWALSRRDEFSERKHVITWCDYDLQWSGVLFQDDGDYELDTRNLSFLNRKYTLEVIGNIHEDSL